MTYRILVVDDSTTIQKIFKIAFSRHDVLVIAAGSMIEAINEINRHRPDLLVMDASLPGTKRPLDFKSIQEDADNAPVLLLVGSHENLDEQGFRDVGMPHFLRKPFETQDILRAVALVMGEEIPLRRDDEEPTKLISSEPDVPLKVQIPPPPAFQSGSSVQTPTGNLPPLPNTPRIDLSSLGNINLEEMPQHSPRPAQGNERRGQRVFGGDEPTKKAERSFPDPYDQDDPGSVFQPQNVGSRVERIESPPPRVPDDDVELRQDIRERLEDFISAEAPVIVRKAVEAYCEKHFAELAKAVLTAELRRLADEKARLLVDT